VLSCSNRNWDICDLEVLNIRDNSVCNREMYNISSIMLMLSKLISQLKVRAVTQKSSHSNKLGSIPRISDKVAVS
jgi:hypothetical protein